MSFRQYSAHNELACIIGAKTGKVLYVSFKSKYCPICARALTKNIKAATHKCSKNWDGSSTFMESELILEGFRNTIKMQKLKYVKIIGDGDCSVYKKICLERPYGRTMVRKVECINHLLRNY
ncbi:unnamed protein product [Psylliodes chrysocephalus]|uniref:Mutator-like transposase domain-containing protein n=1 Tax=Psylliodes chrysocephalus TaxID=3402493 RepID=A0A9P0CXJ1_9CUCU|nr:unnamed protein product [Psylliodes chrysocephala]